MASTVKPAGWFSRRHETDEVHRVASAINHNRHADKLARVAERARLRSLRTAREQLARLDKTLGPGLGAKRERARLARAA